MVCYTAAGGLSLLPKQSFMLGKVTQVFLTFDVALLQQHSELTSASGLRCSEEYAVVDFELMVIFNNNYCYSSMLLKNCDMPPAL